MPKRTAIIGAGGLGRETFDLIRSFDPQGEQWEIQGFIDKAPDERLLNDMGSKWLGTDDDFLGAPDSDCVVLAVGDPQIRSYLAQHYVEAGVPIASIIHPTAIVGSLTSIGVGSIVSAGAMVLNNCQIGSFVLIDRSAMVGHDCVIRDFVTLHPASVVSGGVRIGDRSRLGTCSCVLPNLKIGKSVTIGAGAVVDADLLDGVTAVGVPARPLREK